MNLIGTLCCNFDCSKSQTSPSNAAGIGKSSLFIKCNEKRSFEAMTRQADAEQV